jgi:hypothetical protein
MCFSLFFINIKDQGKATEQLLTFGAKSILPIYRLPQP